MDRAPACQQAVFVRVTAACLLWLCVCLGVFQEAASAEGIYYYRDEKGVLHFTDLPDSRRYKPYMLFGQAAERLDRKSILRLIRKYSRHHDMDSHLVRAVLEVESDYDPKARSQAGAEGLMQIMPETQKELGLTSPFDPAANIEAGIRYLKKMLNRFSDLETALAAYNAGPTCVSEYQGIPPYPETRRYVDKVITAYARMKGRE
jgi:soluble lytic murein transglycosylase-like protein